MATIGFILLVGVCFMILPGCQGGKVETPRQRFNSSDFNATNAFGDIESLTAIGARNPGSPGAQKAAEYLLSRLRAAGIEAVIDEFEEESPSGKIVFRNVSGVLHGVGADGKPAKDWIIIGAHYDTKVGIADNFVGANDSSSGAGVVLELARVMRATDINVMFVFFDGEECFRRYGKDDGLRGSLRLAEQLKHDGRAVNTRAVVILDMIADRDLNVTIPRNSDSKLISALFGAAEKEGTRAKFSLSPLEILDDHAPFMAAGIPAIDIIDYTYGSAPGLNDYWHTPEDTMDKLSVENVGIIGRTVLRLVDDLTIKQKPHCK